LKRLRNDEKGDAVLITVILLLSIALTLGGNLLLAYGESLGKEEDMLHMTDVEDSFMRMRGSMFTLLEAKDTDSLVVQRFTLGTDGNSYLGIGRSSGKFGMDPSTFEITVGVKTAGILDKINSVSGQITFESRNYYFDDQTMTYQNGAVIVDEYDHKTVADPPPVSIQRYSSGFGMEFNLYGISGNSFEISGIETTMLKMNMISQSSNFREVRSDESILVIIDSDARDAWEDWFRSYLGENSLVEGAGNDFLISTNLDGELEVEIFNSLEVRVVSGIMEVRI
jgi:hypothetical protein